MIIVIYFHDGKTVKYNKDNAYVIRAIIFCKRVIVKSSDSLYSIVSKTAWKLWMLAERVKNESEYFSWFIIIYT